MANFNIQIIINFRALIKNREGFFKISSRKRNVMGIGGPGVITVNLLNRGEVIVKERGEEIIFKAKHKICYLCQNIWSTFNNLSSARIGTV